MKIIRSSGIRYTETLITSKVNFQELNFMLNLSMRIIVNNKADWRTLLIHEDSSYAPALNEFQIWH